MDRHFLGGFHPETDLVPTDFHHHNRDVVVDDDALVLLPRQDKHGSFLDARATDTVRGTAASLTGPTGVGMSKFVNRFKPSNCKCFRCFVKLRNALLGSFGLFAPVCPPKRPLGEERQLDSLARRGRREPRALRSQPDRGDRLSAASQPPDLLRHRLQYRSGLTEADQGALPGACAGDAGRGLWGFPLLLYFVSTVD